MAYRGYALEQKTFMVGWQIAITKNGKFIRRRTVTTNLAAAMDEADKFVDRVLAEIGTVASDARP